ncbi:MAG: L-2-hydroxyglutarate oxidase [Planctomycetales bacterium]|nr:L-2-hydroxyglutarate oxidase [Planctomycetales bacterium]
MAKFDVIIIGGGIVGLATMYRLLQRQPETRVALLEKETLVGQHQTGHNSGVLHSGIYYQPGSKKAINCRLGKLAMEEFCREQEIPFDICGKVIVATDERELPALERIFERGQQNGVKCERIGPERLQELEPHAAGVQAIHVPEAGIVDYKRVASRMAKLSRELGATLHLGHRVDKIEPRGDELVVHSANGAEHTTRWLITCTGLQSDRTAKLSGIVPPARIVPFRGEYYQLVPSAYHLCRNLIYPVPDPNFPFLGVHFTRMIDGQVECGPNAVLAFAREGYRKSDINLADLTESLCYPGFQKLALKYWRMGLSEMWRSASKRAFVSALQRLVPAIRSEDLLPAPAGVRAQAVAADGTMVDDFLILTHEHVINVCNAPSPAATSSLNIGSSIVECLLKAQ